MTSEPARPAPPPPPPAERAAQPIPDSHRDLFEKRAFAHLATLMPNGTPQVTPVWVMLDPQGFIVLTSVKGEQKDRNIRNRRRVALCISDPDNPYRYVTIRGPVVRIAEQGADGDAAALAAKYGVTPPDAPQRPHHARVSYRIRPDHITVRG